MITCTTQYKVPPVLSPLLPMMINADHVADNCYILYVADADSQSKSHEGEVEEEGLQEYIWI